LPRKPRTWSGRRLDPQQRSIILVRDGVDQAIRALPHVADSLVQFRQQSLAPKLVEFVVHRDPLETSGPRDLAAARAADEQVSLPVWETIASVESQTRSAMDGNQTMSG
jgi:hypothetical protein